MNCVVKRIWIDHWIELDETIVLIYNTSKTELKRDREGRSKFGQDLGFFVQESGEDDDVMVTSAACCTATEDAHVDWSTATSTGQR